MKKSLLITAFTCFSIINGFAADGYDASLKQGEAKAKAGDLDGAIAEYVEAKVQAKTDTQRALATGKKGLLLIKKKDFKGAKAEAEAALGMTSLEPIGKVTCFEVLALCQMKDEEDYEAAIDTLNKALELKNVDWSKPHMTLMLGDCQRLSGKFQDSLETFKSIDEMSNANPTIKAIAWQNMGFTYQYGLKDNVKAKEAYSKAIELNPELKSSIEANHLSKIQ